MKKISLWIMILLFIALFMIPSLSLADKDYEEGDGWIYKDGELKITESEGLVNFIYHDEELICDPPNQEKLFVVDRVIIGKNVTADIEIEYYIAVDILSKTTIEEGNPCYIVENGWIVNTASKTLFGAADVEKKKTLSSIDDIPNDIEHIGMYAFYNYYTLKRITIPDSVVSFGESCFDNCDSLESIALPNGLKSIGIGAFAGCTSLKHIDFGPNVKEIGTAAFFSCIHLEPPPFYNMQLDTIYGNSFWGCDTFQTVEFSPKLRLVENQAFAHCSKLTSLIFHSDQLILENGAFDACENIRKLVFTKGKPASIGDSLFNENERTPDGKSFITRLYDPNGKVIPYPTLYYTADYAAAWAPNGETEWNGYPIQQISQEELDAILKETRGEEASVASASPVPTETPQTETPAPDESLSKPALVIGIRSILFFEICIVAIVFAVIAILRSRKGKK